MKRATNLASNLLLLLLAIYPQIALLRESLDCVSTPSLSLWIFALCVFTWFAAGFHRGLFVGMPLSALTLYFAYRQFGAEPVAELNDLIDKLSGAYYESIYAPGSAYDYLNAAPEQSFILLLLAFLLAAYLSSALTSRNGRVVMSLLGTVPFFAGCLMVNGTPSVLPVLGMLLFWALLLVSGGRYDAESNNGRAVFLTLLPLTLLLLVLLSFNRPENYRAEEQDQRMTQLFDEWSRRFNRWVGGGGDDLSQVYSARETDEQDPEETPVPIYSGSPWRSEQGAMDLTAPYDPEQLDTLLFSVRSEITGNLYLRTVSYGDYTGTGWLPAELGDYDSLPFTARALSSYAERRTISVRGYAEMAYLCAPYFCPESGRESFLPSRGQRSYDLDYLHYVGDFSDITLSEDDRLLEAEYAGSARSYYTRLSSDTADALLAVCAEAGITPDSPELITQVAEYVQSLGEYTLEQTAYPSGDYALYFLREARSGYCIHFATAATALYRALGVPARITEGFLVAAEAGIYTEVRVANAHAWVEVYLDGIGWIPVEVTGQSGLEETAASDAPQEAAAPAEENGLPANEAAPEIPDEPEEPTETLPVGILSEAEDNIDASSVRRFPRRVLLALFLLLLLTTLFPLWRLLSLRRMERRISQPDRRRCAVAIWQYASRAAAYGAPVPRAIRDTAEKASFSLHEITEEELTLCRSLLKEFIAEVCQGLSPAKQLRFKYLWGLL